MKMKDGYYSCRDKVQQLCCGCSCCAFQQIYPVVLAPSTTWEKTKRQFLSRYAVIIGIVIFVYSLLLMKQEVSSNLRGNFFETHHRKYTNCVTPNADTSDMYTVVVSTYNRDDQLLKNLDHWLSCPNVYQVQVVWHDPLRRIPRMLENMENEFTCDNTKVPKLFVRPQTDDKLTNRFKNPAGGFETEAVFNIDDDAVVDCHLMSVAFREWKELGKYSMVGFEPRQIDWHSEGQGYRWYHSCVSNDCSYNTLWPTKGAFLHRQYYSMFWDEVYDDARNLVDQYFTGEDILMTFVHFHSYFERTKRSPPILSVQVTDRYKKHYTDRPDRFSTFQKLLRLPHVLLYQIGVYEISSLGARSSWNRGVIREAVSILSNKLTQPDIIPPSTNVWLFVNTTEQNVFITSPCLQTPSYKLECSTKVSLNVLNSRETIWLTIFSIVFVVVLVSCVRIIRTKMINMSRRSRKLTECSFDEEPEKPVSPKGQSRLRVHESFHV